MATHDKSKIYDFVLYYVSIGYLGLVGLKKTKKQKKHSYIKLR